MVTGAKYGTRYWGDFVAPDGYFYRLKLQRQNYSDPAPTAEVELASVVLRWAVDRSTAPLAPLAPLAPATCDVVVLDDRRGLLAETVGSEDGRWRCRLTRGASADDREADLVYQGYLLPETYEDRPWEGRAAVSLRFADGLGFLEERPLIDDEAGFTDVVDTGLGATAAERVVDTVARILSALGGDHAANDGSWEGLVTGVDLRPYLPDPGDGSVHVAATTDPLRALYTLRAAWLDEEDVSEGQLDALHALAGRFLARLFQSGGKWYLVERRALATDPASVPVFTYGVDAGGIDTSSSSRADTDLRRDLTTWDVRRGATRAVALPVRSVEVPYAFDPPITSVLYNGSFEEARFGDTTSGDPPVVSVDPFARYWTLFNGTSDGGRIAANEGDDSPLGAAFEDIRVLQLFGYGPTEDVTGIRQEDLVFIPESDEWRFDLTYAFFLSGSSGGSTTVTGYGGFLVSIGASLLSADDAAVGGYSFAGKDARVYVEPLLDGVPGAVEGTPVIPEGARLEFVDNTGAPVASLLLTEAAKVGDAILVGDLSDDVDSPATARFFYWSGTGYPLHGAGPEMTDYRHSSTRHVFATGYRIDGSLVSGYVSVEIYGGTLDEDGWGGYPISRYDDVRLSIADKGTGLAVFTYTASRPTTTAGLAETLPDARVGDGPLPDSETRLVVEGDDGSAYDTAQGDETGWTTGAYAGGEPSSEARLDALVGRVALQQVSGPLERWVALVRLRAGQTLYPHEVPLLPSATTLAEVGAVGADFVMLHAAPPVGAALTLSPGTAREETHTVLSVTRDVGRFAVHLDGTALASIHYNGELATYAFPAWWEAFEWDVGEGTVALNCSALALADDAEYTDLFTLGT